jgi:hypothetical protein
MGVLYYGADGSELEFDDRLLAHLKVVIVAKLRRRESFTMSWELEHAQGSGRETIWLDPSIALRFRFYGGRPPQLNRAWLDALTRMANKGDMRLVPEPSTNEPVAHPLGEFS